MNRFDGIKKVKVSLSRNTYGRPKSKKRPNVAAAYPISESEKSGFKGEKSGIKRGTWLTLSAVVRVTLAAVMILTVMAMSKAGTDVAGLFRQDYIATYVD